MERPVLPRRIPEAIRAGARGRFSRTFTEADVSLFVAVTWDVNPYHTDHPFAAASLFGAPIVPGLLTASLLTHIGGLWAFLASSMDFEFLAPVFVGDTVTAEAVVAEVDPAGIVCLACSCQNQEGRPVLRGHIRGKPARQE